MLGLVPSGCYGVVSRMAALRGLALESRLSAFV